MQIIISDPYYGTDQDDECDFSQEILRKLEDVTLEGSVRYTNIGHGADVPAFLVSLISSIDISTFLVTLAPGVFFLGKQIEENLDAWRRIANRLKSLFKSIQPASIDENIAILLFMNEVAEKYDLKDLQLDIQVIKGTSTFGSGEGIDASPDRIYLLTARLHDQVIIKGMSSSGKELFNLSTGLDWTEFMNI